MKWRAVRADAVYLFRHWSRSGQAVVISLIVPLILLAAFGFVFQDTPQEQPVVLVDDRADSNASRAFTTILSEDGLVTVRAGAVPATGQSSWMSEHGLAGAVTLGAAFDNTTNASALADAVTLLVSNEDAVAARVVTAAVERAAAFSLDPDSGASGVVSVETRDVPRDSGYRAFLLPGILGLSVALSGISAGYSSITELKHMGLLQRLAASPLKKSEWLLGRMLGSVAIGAVASTGLLIAAWLLDRGAFRVGAWTVLLIVGGTLVFAGLGTLLGLAVERPETGTAVLNLALLPLVLLSGTFFSLEALPAGARWLSAASPLTHLTDGLRADMLPHATGSASASTAVVFLIALVVLVAGARLIRWTERS